MVQVSQRALPFALGPVGLQNIFGEAKTALKMTLNNAEPFWKHFNNGERNKEKIAQFQVKKQRRADNIG